VVVESDVVVFLTRHLGKGRWKRLALSHLRARGRTSTRAAGW
jgi:hypothetical protein